MTLKKGLNATISNCTLWGFGKVPFVFTLGILLLLLPACEGEQNVGEEGVKLIEEKTSDYVGETVTVKGKVLEVMSSNAFILEADEPFRDENMLVVSENELTLSADDVAEVTGTVKDMTIANVQFEYNFNLERAWQVKLDEKPILVADITNVISANIEPPQP